MSNTTGLTVTREIRGGTAHWIHITGPIALDRNAPRKAGAAARQWARDLGKGRAYRVSGGGSYNCDESGGQGTFRYSVCYGFEG
jgi:hypothetical protein